MNNPEENSNMQETIVFRVSAYAKIIWNTVVVILVPLLTKIERWYVHLVPNIGSQDFLTEQ
jgi:hypothetical protein